MKAATLIVIGIVLSSSWITGQVQQAATPRFALPSEPRIIETAHQPWRLLDLPKIESLETPDQTFPGSRNTAGQHHHVWDVVYARVE